jgi:beta-xylosidase
MSETRYVEGPEEYDPVVKFDGDGNAVRLSQMGWNRKARRHWLHQYKANRRREIRAAERNAR